MKSQGKPQVHQGHFDSGPPSNEGGDPALALVAGGRTMQRSQTQYQTAIAVQKPRSRTEVQKAVLEEAKLAGEDFFYSWTTNNKDGSRGLIEGLSIEGAMIIARNWGNNTTEIELVVDAPTHWVFKATFIDFETGFNVPRLFRQRKNQTAGGRMDADRMMDIAFQIGQSKAQRNAVDKAMPNWLKESALDEAKKAGEGKFKDLPAANKKALEIYGKMGVTQAQLEAKIGLSIEHWTPRDHVSLAGLLRAIRDRQTTLAAEFPKETPKAPPAPEAEKQVPDDAVGTDVPSGDDVTDGYGDATAPDGVVGSSESDVSE